SEVCLAKCGVVWRKYLVVVQVSRKAQFKPRSDTSLYLRADIICPIVGFGIHYSILMEVFEAKSVGDFVTTALDIQCVVMDGCILAYYVFGPIRNGSGQPVCSDKVGNRFFHGALMAYGRSIIGVLLTCRHY